MTTAANYLIRKIETVITLEEPERQAILGLPVTIRKFERGETIVREGDHPKNSFAVLDGVTAMVKTTGQGDRHVVIFHFTSDIPDLHSLHLERLDVAVEAASSCAVGFMPHESLRAVCAKFPRVNNVLWRATLVDASILRECALSIAQRPALNRIAHLLCEFVVRLKLAGLGTEDGCELPLTQAEIGDCLGITYVHVNRVLQTLRKQKLIDLESDRLRVHDWPGLVQIGDFDANYLHLTPRQREMLRAL